MKKRTDEPPATPANSTPTAVTPRSLAALIALGVLSAVWALVLWGQSVLARGGGDPFCPLGDAGDCARVWDSTFAATVHRVSGLPVAAWGVVWGLAAFILPLAGLMRRAEGHDAPALLTAIRLTAAAGVLTVFVTAGVSASEGAFCGGCFVSYVLVAAYAGIALFAWRDVGVPDLQGGLATSAGIVLLGFVALLYPGVKTPHEPAEAGRQAVALAPPIAESAPPVTLGASTPPLPVAASAPASDAVHDKPLADFIASLAPEQKKTLSDALYQYRNGPAGPLPSPRTLLGPASAPVRITEFTDVLCSHCATLHATLSTLRARLPKDSFSVEPRYYPLDGDCNPFVTARRGDPVRCLAAKARVCVEGKPGADDFAGALFANQRSLTPEKVFALAAPVLARPALEACIARPETAAKLREDVDLAARYKLEGTPLVLVNGRRGNSLAPFLYAMVLSGGSADSPAFASLPAPNPAAHLH